MHLTAEQWLLLFALAAIFEVFPGSEIIGVG